MKEDPNMELERGMVMKERNWKGKHCRKGCDMERMNEAGDGRDEIDLLTFTSTCYY